MRKRKALRKERAAAINNDITIKWLHGAEITEAHWDAFFDFYLDTGSRKWGRPYLNRAFFSMIGERMAGDLLLILAERDGLPNAGALNFIGGDTLYGRYWGCVKITRFCISSSAITRPLILPSRINWSAWKPGRKAPTSWPAATPRC